MEVLLARSRQEVQKLGNANVALMRDLAALRESWVSHVKIPAEVQELLTNLRLASPQLMFNNSGAPNDTAIPIGSLNQCITQPLPMGARGLLGFDLNVTNIGAGQGVLFTQLLAHDTGAALAKRANTVLCALPRLASLSVAKCGYYCVTGSGASRLDRERNRSHTA